MMDEQLVSQSRLTGRILMDRRAAPAPEDAEALTDFFAAAGCECQGFTTAELETGAVSLMIDAFPMTTEWLARCRAALGDTAFLACAPEDPERLADYRQSLDAVLPLYEARRDRESAPLLGFPRLPTDH